MRRSDREITDFQEKIAILQKCEVCRIALNDPNSGYPYILPLNFGLKVAGTRVELYFHGALEGTKYALIQADPRASFEVDCGHLAPEPEQGNCTTEYESVIGQGHIEMLPDAEIPDALDILMAHYHQEEFPWNRAVIPRTKMFKLIVESMTAKKRSKKA